MVCEKCGEKIPEGEMFKHGGQDLCEDCYLEIISVPKACDPLAVRSARLTREKLGQKGTEGLLPVQKGIYEYLQGCVQATKDEIATEFNIDQKELEKHLAVLRHCELVRGMKEKGKIYMTLMNTGDNAN
ncbi:MAG: hypothetical protein ACOX6Z_03985 [Dethiobacteria bacterium]